MSDATAVGADIARLVQTSPNRTVLGSLLAVLLQRVHPAFRPEDFGCRNLREFIRRHVKEVFETARRGTDVLYSASLLPTMGEVSNSQQELRNMSSPPTFQRRQFIPTAVWKTFVSPNAFYRIFANRGTGEFRVLQRHEQALDTPWLQVPSCSAEIHLKIAREFVQNLPDEVTKTELTKILGLDSWWYHFFFSARNFGVERQWSAFRRRQLHDEFDRQLKSLGVPLPASPITPAVASSVVEASDVPQRDEDNATLRRIASAVIRRLPTSELREVWLPLGYVLDEIGEK
jgi:hypothetical protein